MQRLTRRNIFPALLLLCACAVLLSGCNFGGTRDEATAEPTAVSTTAEQPTQPEATAAPAEATQTPESGGAVAPNEPTATPQEAVQQPPQETPQQSAQETPQETPQEQPTEVAAVQPTTEPAPTGENATGANTVSNADLAGRVLAWNPNDGVLAYYAASGQPQNVLTDQDAASRAYICTQRGDQIVMFLGGDVGELQLYDLGSSSTTSLGETHAIGCAFPDRVQYSPDGARLGTLSYEADVVRANSQFAVGTLRILSLPDADEQYSASDVTDYQLYDDGALILQFFGGESGGSQTAMLVWWDGTGERRLLSDFIRSSENCAFAQGTAIRIEDTIYTLFGERCTGNNRGTWRVMRTNFADGASDNIATGASRGAYVTYAALSDIRQVADGLMITIPNGLVDSVVDVARIPLEGGEPQVLIEGAYVDRYPAAPPPSGLLGIGSRRLSFSPAGDRLTAVTRDNNQGETLIVWDALTAGSEPETVAGGNRSDRIPAYAWTGNRLFYVIRGDVNALYFLDLEGAARSQLVAQGTYETVAVSPNSGETAIVVEREEIDRTDARYNLLQITAADGRSVPLIEGEEGEVALVPLVAR
jgi:hypothetical protein